MKLLAFLALFGLCQAASIAPDTKDNPLYTCYTNPCVTVPGIGKILGTKKVLKTKAIILNKLNNS